MAAAHTIRINQVQPHRPREPRLWPLKLAVFFFVLGTVPYVTRDAFHADESILQPIIEISSVVIGTCLSIGAAAANRTKFAIRAPYFLLLSTLLLALVFSSRSWDPLLSLTRGGLLIMISVSTVALFQTYGLKPMVRHLLNSYFILIAFSVIVGLVAPDEFPLMLHDPGEEAVRMRLHLLRIHPIALADDCAISLLLSVLVPGRWTAFLRVVFVTCLLLTVTRASIAFGLPLYIVAELLYSQFSSRGIKPVRLIGGLAIAAALVIVLLVFVFSDWSVAEDLRTTITHVVDATKDNVTLNGRTSVWNMLIGDLSFDNVYGYGIGGARYYLRTVNPWFSHSHNSGLETIYVAGYFGLGLILLALAGAMTACLAAWRVREVRVVAVTLLYVIAVGMMNPSWYESSSLMLLSIACSGQWMKVARRVHFSNILPMRLVRA